jgi:glycosyltransferase involved in cell wall biosynthesis
LADRVTDLSVVVVGEGPYELELRRRVEEEGVGERVVFLGHRHDVHGVLPAADVFVHPTHTDVLPTGVIEAMAVALPVVASDTGGLPELIEDGVSGRLVPPSDPVQLGAAIEQLVRDPSRAAVLGNNARLRVERDYTIAQQVARLDDLYRRALGRRHA